MVPIPEASAQAIAFEQARFLLWLLEGVAGFVVLFVLCWSGFSARIRTFAERRSPNAWLGAVAGYGFLLAILLAVFALPFSWMGVLLRREFGLPDIDAATWLGNEGARIVWRAALVAALLWVPYLILRRAGERAWFVCWCGMAALIVLMKVVGPTVIDPMMQPVQPLKDARLAQALRALAGEAGMGNLSIVVDQEEGAGSRVAADVRGIGPGARIRVSSALLALPEDEIAFAVAHEIAHHVLGHLLQDAALALGIWLVALLAAQKIGARIAQSFAPRLGFSSLTDVASAPLLAAILMGVMAVCSPLENALARHEEHEADVFALELTRNGKAAAQLLARSHTRLSNPRREGLIQILRHGHPALADRIAFAREYRPWETGGTLRFEQRFRRSKVVGQE